MTTHDPTSLLASAPVVLEIPVAWGEMDALGHVNNAVYFRYLESARVEFIRRLGWKAPDQGSGHLGRKGVGFILQAVQCRFRRPVVYPDTLAVTARLAGIGEDRFTLRHEIISKTRGEVAALGEGTIVTYDYSRGSKVRIPNDLRAMLKPA
ncbi:MAG: acyl-CoA thioesterase [Leptolyngbya sp. PLA1]|nr:acyl-CoA thioesterase [Leptolyngbya sp. PLA1]